MGTEFQFVLCSVASVMSNSLRPYGLWNFPGKSTRVGCHALLQRIFLTERLNLRLLCLLHAGDFLPTEPPGEPKVNWEGRNKTVFVSI